MSHCPQQGKGKDGATVTQGETVRTSDGLVGTAESFGGGRHTSVTVRSGSGYRYTVDTDTVAPVEKKT